MAQKLLFVILAICTTLQTKGQETDNIQDKQLSPVGTTTIKRAAAVEGAFELVKDVSKLAVGDELVITWHTKLFGIGIEQNANNRGFGSLKKNDDGTVSSLDNKIAVFTLGGGTGEWTFKDNLGYLYAAGTRSGQNYLRTRSTVTNAAKASISINTSTGLATIIFKGSSTSNYLKYKNDSGGIFSCYTASAADTYYLNIYKRVNRAQGSFEISSSRYATRFSDDEFIMPEGVTGYGISSAIGHINYSPVYRAGDIVPSRTPILLEGNAGTYTYFITDTKITPPEDNLLVGSDGSTVDEDGYLYYKLAYKSATEKVIGFYWDAPDGKSITIAAGKAFLKVPVSSAAKEYRFDDATDVKVRPANAIREKGNIFDLNGKEMGRDSNVLPKGLYIQNGQKIIVK